MISSYYSTLLFSSLPTEDLLEDDEVILIVDDYPDLIYMIQDFLKNQGFSTVTAGSAGEMYTALREHHVAMILLDIGLPDGDGIKLLPDIFQTYPDTSIIMLTADTNLQTALACLRQGADDYLAKPVQFDELIEIIRKILEKRRLAINNRRYQIQLERAHFRIQLIHELSQKMNSAYLSMVELDELLQAILVGITAKEGLQFNRAFLALLNEDTNKLKGKLAIGPDCRENADQIWREMQDNNLDFYSIISKIKEKSQMKDSEVNRIVQQLSVDISQQDHILIRTALERRPANVINGQCDFHVPESLYELLHENSFVVVPLFSPSKSLGVIIADNFVTHKPISDDLVRALESFAGQASLAIEHSHLYRNMELKIEELEELTQELDKNRDLLVEAERFSALGHMAAQLAHNLRNPITTIGGTARILSRKIVNPEYHKFFNAMIDETKKIENILQDLFSFVESATTQREPVELYSVIHKSLMHFLSTMQKQGITYRLILPEPEPIIRVDKKLIQKVFINLFCNSIESMLDGGTLTVEVSLAEIGEIIINIKDTGILVEGINLTRVKEPFYTTKTFGTGMGLTIVDRIIDTHGGLFEISRHDEDSTTARIHLFKC